MPIPKIEEQKAILKKIEKHDQIISDAQNIISKEETEIMHIIDMVLGV